MSKGKGKGRGRKASPVLLRPKLDRVLVKREPQSTTIVPASRSTSATIAGTHGISRSGPGVPDGRATRSTGCAPKSATALTVLVLVLGILMAIPAVTSKVDPGPRTGNVPNFEAMQKAKQPPWVSFLNPLVGAAGVLTGAKLRRPPAA